jgi:hypothetical protein
MKYTILFVILTAIFLAGPANPEITFLDALSFSRDVVIDVAAYAFVTIMVIVLAMHYCKNGVVIGVCIALAIVCFFIITGLNRGWIGAITWIALLILSVRADLDVRKVVKAPVGDNV